MSVLILFSFSVCLADPKTGSLELEDALEMDLEELLALTVTTPSRTLEHIKKTAASVTVITDKQIRQMGARNIMDVLSTVPGLGITTYNYGWYEIESRGVKTAESEKILIMVNSHPLNVNYSGGALINYHNLIIENIKKIEVIRGPGSAIYGANAFLAVINIITKDREDLDGLEYTAGGGSYGTQQHNLMFGKEVKGLNIFANVNFFDTDGFKEFVPEDVQTTNDVSMGTNASKAPGCTSSGQRKYDLDLKLEYHDFVFKGRYIKDKRELFAGVANALDDKGYLEFDNYFLELSHSHDFLANLNVNAKLYRDYEFRDSFYVVFPPGYTNPQGVFPEGYLGAPTEKNTKHGGEVQITYDWSESNKVIWGVMGEYQRQFDVTHETNFNPITGEPLGSFQDVSSWANFNKNISRKLWALYGEDIWDIRDNLRLTVGARYDHYSDFGGSFNPRAGIVWEFIKGYDLKLLYGRAFRAPSFGEMYITNNPVILGNPDLDPEKVETIEASFGAEIMDFLSGRVTLFRNDIQDVIAQSDPDSTGLRLHENSDNVISEGVEVEMKAEFGEGSYLAMNYTWQNPRNEDTGRLADVPGHKGNIMVNWEINEHFNWYAQLFLKGSTPRTAGDARSDVPGYGIANTTFIAKDFLKGWGDDLELRLSVYNILDKEYQDPAPVNTLPDDYPRPGISAFFEVRYTFN